MRLCFALILISNILYSCSDKQELLLEAKRKIRERKFEEAISILEQLDDEHPEVLNALGVAYLELEQNGKALDYLARAIAAAPQDYRPYYNRGNVYRKLNRPMEAIEEYSKALSLNNFQYEIYLNRALVYASIGQFEAAAADFEASANLDKGKDRNVYYYMGLNYLSMKQPHLAIEPFAVCCRIDSTFADAFYQLAISQIGSGLIDKQIACANLKKASHLGHPRAESLLSGICQ